MQKLTLVGLRGPLGPRFGLANLDSHIDGTGSVLVTASVTLDDIGRKYSFDTPKTPLKESDRIVFLRSPKSDTILFEVNQRPVDVREHLSSVLQALGNLWENNRNSAIYRPADKHRNREALYQLLFSLAQMAIAK